MRRGGGVASLGALFDRVAADRMHAVAISDGRRQISYGELDERSNALASRLVAAGSDAGDRIGLACSRGTGVVVGILGILKAGKAYVPLDPTYPSDRLRFMIADAGLSVAVTDRPCDGPLAALEQFVADAPAAHVDALSRLPQVTPESPAYVMYTSGSTGQPKGVVVTHRNVLAMLDGCRSALHFTAADTWTMFHSYCFDFSVLELWSAVQHGGKLSVFREEVIGDPEWTLAQLASEQVTVFSQIPSVFRHLAEERSVARRPVCVRTLLFGGEPLDLEAVELWLMAEQREPPAIVNLYGITETTVVATYRPVAVADLARAETRTAIGRPFPHVRVAVLDEQLEPVVPGEIGQIFVAGDCLAAGYLNRPDLTRERFLELSIDGNPRRWYRSGDLARSDGGALQYVGRVDDQVKIRGLRIEPAEIETALASLAGVRSVAVVAQETASGDVILNAFYVADESCEATIRSDARRLLPPQMIPTRFTRVPGLPLSPAGKLDRRQLAELASARDRGTRADVDSKSRDVRIVDPPFRANLDSRSR